MFFKFIDFKYSKPNTTVNQLWKVPKDQGWLHVEGRVVTRPPWLGKVIIIIYINLKKFMSCPSLKKSCDHPKKNYWNATAKDHYTCITLFIYFLHSQTEGECLVTFLKQKVIVLQFLLNSLGNSKTKSNCFAIST